MPKMQRLAEGLLVISVDLDLPAGVSPASGKFGSGGVGGQLLQLVDRLQIPATWALADPVHSVFAERLRLLGPGQEIAVLGDSTWVGSGAPRTKFSQELSRRVLCARAAGIAVSTLIPFDTTLDDHLDLVVKYGITAIRSGVDRAGSARRPALPGPLHFGLWEVPGSLSLPGDSKWKPGGGRGWRARRGIDHAATGGFFHLVIDAAQLSAAGAGAMKTVEKTLAYAARHRAQGSLKIATLATVALRFSQGRQSAPARSILRPTA